MLLNQETAHVLSGGDEMETAGYSAAANSKMFSLLTSGLYSNKISSVCRELISNQWDAHADAGILDVPFKITAPTFLETQCSFRDYGKGISHKAMMTEYTVLFLSSKEFTNNAIGCYGIGRMTPLAMSDSYIVVSRHEGTKSTYNIYMDETKAPRIMLVSQESCTDSGFEVIVPCQAKDISEWQSEITTYIKYLETKPDVNFEYTVPEPYLKCNNWEIFQREDSLVYWPSDNKFMVRQGITTYKVDLAQLDIGLRDKAFYNTVVVDVPIGTFQVTLSREDIEYDTRTKANLHTIYEQTVSEVKQAILDDLDKTADSPFERLKAYSDYANTIKLPTGMLFNYKGKAYKYTSSLSITNGHIEPDKHFTRWDDDAKKHRHRFDNYTVPYKPKFRINIVDMYACRNATHPQAIREMTSGKYTTKRIRFFKRTTNRWRARLLENRALLDKETYLYFISAAHGYTLDEAVKAFEDEWGVKVEDLDTWGVDPQKSTNTNRVYQKTPIFELAKKPRTYNADKTWRGIEGQAFTDLLATTTVKRYYLNLNRFRASLGSNKDIAPVDVGYIFQYLKDHKLIDDTACLYGVPKGNSALIDELDSSWVSLHSVLQSNRKLLEKHIKREKTAKKYAASFAYIKKRGKLYEDTDVLRLQGELILGSSVYRTYKRLDRLDSSANSIDRDGVLRNLAEAFGLISEYPLPSEATTKLLKSKVEEVRNQILTAQTDPVIRTVTAGYYTRTQDETKREAIEHYVKMTKELNQLRAKVALLEKGTN